MFRCFGRSYGQFRRAEHGNFVQPRPQLSHPFLADGPLQSFLTNHVPDEAARREIEGDLERFGGRVAGEAEALGRECEEQPPQLQPHDAWGQRVDRLRTCEAWGQLKALAAQEGLVAIPYERRLDCWSRIHQICKLYLFAPSSGLVSCPIAMTDGAAKTIQTQLNYITNGKKSLLQKAYSKLTNRDSNLFWTSGQWMTEKRGGSDVANATETIAVAEGDDHRLYGYKWFSSASDSDMALTLARTAEVNDDLSMFYLETRKPDGGLNHFQMVRLKDKLGTRQLPTAELLLDGSLAHKISDGRGIASISPMLTITRLHNALGAVSYMRRILMLSRDYSFKRMAFGKRLCDIPLHMRILSNMEVETRAALLLLLKVSLLLGKVESGVATRDEALLLRVAMPLLKLYTAKQAVSVCSEGLETFGGQGYMEDSHIPVIFRDSQILPIWEGTTNVMSLDVLRSLLTTKGDSFSILGKFISLCLETGAQITDLTKSCKNVESSIKNISKFIQTQPHSLDIAARDIAYSLARTYMGALLIENAAISKKDIDVFVATEWCEMQELCPVSLHQNYSAYKSKDYECVMENYIEKR